ncbi:MAG: hypothetical protein NTX24_00965 [Candidatus Pacearchaeota archaeon]|nr:hypothetical protein [Candidatus Pacearchaeota archaeon]
MKMDKEAMKKEGTRGMKEFDLAWKEFFKNKLHPKNDEEEKKELEEFGHWYNYVRKQSDTGKTPAEMYKEIYGKEPSQNLPINSQEPGRMINFEWDGDYNESDLKGEDELDESQEGAVVVATEIFEDSWKRIKQEIDGVDKKEACKYSFILGFLDYLKMMDKKAELMEKKMKKMSKEEIEKFIDNFKEYKKN